MKVKIVNKSGPADSLEVSSDVFSLKENPELISQALQKELANRRRSIAHTLDRGEVAGGGRKPWRQKGTGNARAGSNRSPLWRGGGITFGPRNTRNFSKKLPKKMAAQAIKMALSDKIRDKKLILVSSLHLQKISTRAVQDFLEKLPIQEGKILVVLGKTNINLELSTANLKYIKTVLVDGMNLLDIINHDYLITDKEALKAIEKRFMAKSDVTSDRPAPAKQGHRDKNGNSY